MKKFLICLTLVLALLSTPETLALTDPEPNPFINLAAGERTFTGKISAVDAEVLTVKDTTGKEYFGRLDAIYKYREGAGPAAENEFFVGDTVRVLISAEGVLLAAQNTNLLLCNQSFSGLVKKPNASNFTLETLTDDNFQVNIGSTTSYRDAANKILPVYMLRENDSVKIHGVVNTNVRQIFTETFGAYIALLSQDAAKQLATEAQAVATKALETEIQTLRANPEFFDVDDKKSFFTAIQFVKRESLINGYQDGSFRSDNVINRAEFTKIIVNAKLSEEIAKFKITQSCFPDVPVDAWFAPFVCLAKSKDIISGYPDGTFGPDRPINLAEAVAIITNVFALEIPAAQTGEIWYQRFIDKTKELKITPQNFSDASALLTRGQMAELTMRAVRHTSGKLKTYLDYLDKN